MRSDTQAMVTVLPLAGLPIIQPGDDLSALLAEALTPLRPEPGDILVVTSKIVSKAEGRFVDLREVEPSPEARRISTLCSKDARLVEVILRESVAVSRIGPRVLITRHRLGFTSANAGVDHSNTSTDPDIVLLLPVNPDGAAVALQTRLEALLGLRMAVIIADSHGRPHRLGTIGVAVGVSGMPAVEDWRGRPDLYGFRLQHTDIGLADMVASAATLVMGQAAEQLPAALVRGVSFVARDGRAAEMYRPPEADLYA
jgi:coenzyme F420-0:L-glutamate ligase/coenzyme F420-1:gamma-L-glutamate ligase